MSATGTVPPAPASKAGPERSGGRPSLGQRLAGLRTHPTARRMLPLLAVAVVAVPVAAALWGSDGWPSELTVNVQKPLDDANQWIADNRDTNPVFVYFLLHLSNAAQNSVDGVTSLLESMGWIGVLVAVTALAWYACGLRRDRRALRVTATSLGAFAVCGLLGVWEPTMETLGLMVVAVAASALVGLLLGLAAGLSDGFDKVLRPVLDTMQVMPAFAYLLPFVLLFDVGVPSALFATVIYAAPPMARLTSLGLRGAEPSALEAAASLGATGPQRLWTARLPLARKEMLLGLNQTIMMALSMVTIASVIGAGGLGDEVFSALSKVNVGDALAAGAAIVLIAVWLDRTTAAAGERLEEAATESYDSKAARDRGPLATAGAYARTWWGQILSVVGLVLVGSLAGRAAGTDWPESWTLTVAKPANTAVNWFTDNLASGVPVVGGTQVWADKFTVWILNPLRDGLQGSPWWLLLLIVAALALLVGTWRTSLTGTLALAAVGVIGLWSTSLDTLAQVLAALVVTLLLGFAVGVWAARAPWLQRAIRPLLDVLQTLPQFIYLIPVVALAGVGRAAAITAAVLYALPAVIRITAQGIRGVDPSALEAARSLGASSAQELRQVQLPLARPALLLAVNQGVVLVLAMVVIGGLVGGGALGYDVVYGLQKSELGIGLTAGVAIVLLGLVLDRVTQPSSAVRERDR
ncbi:ABC transporter permease subunit [Streptomyces sp. ODS28]|uniref:ABC transporter permease n=1 Tax=Streptomyces sp. ODS28 TaxID=3136688 RepID=UPI0031EFB030